MRIRWGIIAPLVALCVQFCIHSDTHAQPTSTVKKDITPNTQVYKISFNFRKESRVYSDTDNTQVADLDAIASQETWIKDSSPTFEPEQLLLQIVTTAPTFWDRFDRLNPFTRPGNYPLDPIELQKDVVRLRQYYKRNGFPTPFVSYSSSQYNAEKDRIHVIFTIREGRPLFIQDIRFSEVDSSYITLQLPEDLQADWMRFRDLIRRNTGARYTEIERIRIQDQILRWFQDHGYAFARVSVQPDIQALQRTVDLRFVVDKGPQGYVSSIALEGNESIEDGVLLRELPFTTGDAFSITELREGQQELFGLNLFRVALTDVPNQPRDSTVDVRIRVTEAKRRYLTAETGYSRQDGIGLQGEWVNRNFLGGARNLSINVRANTGFLSSTSAFNAVNVVGKLPARLFRTSASIRQPYLFTTKLSGLFSPFIEFQNDPQLSASNEFLDINRREVGFNSTLIYETLPFRPISLQYTLSQLLSRADETTTSLSRDIYNKSVLELSATFGKTNDYLDPQRGFLLKPFFETAGRLFVSGVQYNKTGLEVISYVPVTRRLNLSSRFFAGTMFTFGKSNRSLADRSCTLPAAQNLLTDAENALCLQYENRFDPIFFYAGGGNDTRGWNFQLLGPKIARADTLKENGEVKIEDGVPVFDSFFYERVGGTSKVIGNIELRSRLPGMGPKWQGAAFFDIGQVSNHKIRFKDFRYSTGAGLRYKTIVGFIRVDIAYKLNPSNADLTDPEDAFRFLNGLTTVEPRKKLLRRFGLHVSIGQAF